MDPCPWDAYRPPAAICIGDMDGVATTLWLFVRAPLGPTVYSKIEDTGRGGGHPCYTTYRWRPSAGANVRLAFGRRATITPGAAKDPLARTAYFKIVSLPTLAT